MRISTLAWDTDFFGMRVDKVCISQESDMDALKDLLQSADHDVMYLFADEPTEEQLVQIGEIATLYDIKLTYKKALDITEPQAGGNRVVTYLGELSEELLQLGLMSGQYSRFQLDPGFKKQFNRLYQTWMEKSLDGTLADRLFVYKDLTQMGDSSLYS